jgi:alkylation response protein AidB-like acyl-CoA dehydrogenase
MCTTLVSFLSCAIEAIAICRLAFSPLDHKADMTEKILSRRDLDFLLYEVLDVQSLCLRPKFADHNKETFQSVINVAQALAEDEFYPINRLLDTQEPRLEDGVVVTPDRLKTAVRAYCDSGLMGASFSIADGGMQLPTVVNRAAHAYITAASASGTVFGLTPSNASTLLLHGTPFMREVVVPRMLAGRWFGTMCLSEPHAGSSLSDITTKAIPQADGSYRLFGNKMWISGGDEDISENVIHLVLAKVPGPDGKLIPGTKGISLFMVPKYLIQQDGSLGARNDVVVAGLNHKLGFRGIPNCLMNFGEGAHPVHGQAGAVGHLVGQEHRGLSCMFHMMNDARILVGSIGAAIGYSGYLHSLDYARTRLQGRKPQGKDAAQTPVRIIEHADVRRMLLAQKAYCEAALALVLLCARLSDELSCADDPAQAQQAFLLLELLTPVCKSWPAQWCQEGNSLAIQIHGGYGYTRDFQVEQLWRDQRLNAIHEGTHGIQGLDLLGRKIRMENGQAWALLKARVTTSVERAHAAPQCAAMAAQLLRVQERLDATVETLYAAQSLDVTLANSSAFLEAFGHFVMAWVWLDQALVAQAALGVATGSEQAFYRGKLQAAQWFYAWELPRTGPWLDALDALDTSSLDMQEDWF